MRWQVVLLSVAFGCSDVEPISIGIVGAFSQPEGAGMLWSAETAVDAINATGGIDGRPLRLVAEDDSAQPERAILLAERFKNNPSISAVIGHMTARAALAAARIYNDGPNPLVALTPSASSDDLPNTGPTFFNSARPIQTTASRWPIGHSRAPRSTGRHPLRKRHVRTQPPRRVQVSFRIRRRFNC